MFNINSYLFSILIVLEKKLINLYYMINMVYLNFFYELLSYLRFFIRIGINIILVF